MKLDRRQFLTASTAMLVSCRTNGPLASTDRLDLLLAAHADMLPERPGAGANHYPMAAETLVALGHGSAIPDTWIDDARLYHGEQPRRELARPEDALGDYQRFGDLLRCFATELERVPWRAALAHWAPRLAPGMVGACFHGLLRTAHAVRALSARDTAARRRELAVGLAYWAARYRELPTSLREPNGDLRASLRGLDYPWLERDEDVGFDAVVDRLVEAPIAPTLIVPADPARDLRITVHEMARAFRAMLFAERHRIWLLHAVTGPAAVGLLLPHVDADGAARLVAHARQAAVALYAGYGAPFDPNAPLPTDPEAWPELIERAVASRSVHTIKLIEALHRFRAGDDVLCRSVAAQWLEWR